MLIHLFITLSSGKIEYAEWEYTELSFYENKTLGNYGFRGAMYLLGSHTIKDSIFIGNSAAYDVNTSYHYFGQGGAIYALGARVNIDNTVFLNNKISDGDSQGAAIYSDGLINITGNTLFMEIRGRYLARLITREFIWRMDP